MTGSLWPYIFRRLALVVPLLAAVITVNFVLIQLAPGDPVDLLLGGQAASDEYIAELRADLGLDRPLAARYWSYLTSVASLDFGFSFTNRRPVFDLILERLPATVLLMGSSMALAGVLGVVLGVIASLRPYSWFDNIVSMIAIVGYSLPVFLLGQILLVFLAVELDLFPVQGSQSIRGASGFLGSIADTVWHLILPMVALAFRFLAVNTRITRASMLEVSQRDFVLSARAKGLPERTVVVRHVFRNALLPIVTVLGYNFSFILTGSVLVETVFGWPGIGLLLFESLRLRDMQVILGIFVMGATIALVVNLIVDLLYAAIDPRIRYA